MTTDVIALTKTMPDVWTMVAGLLAAGPDAETDTVGDGAVIQLKDTEGRPFVSVEVPVFVRNPAEVARLLDIEVDGPVWWTEIRAATTADQAYPLAAKIAGRLVALAGGVVWPPTARVDDYATALSGVTASAAAAAPQPAVDVATDRAVVVIQDRPVVPITAWLQDALHGVAQTDQGLHLVTPPGACLTPATRAALAGIPNRWVVQDGTGGYYDGLSGARLAWEEGEFVSTGSMSTLFADETTPARVASEQERQLILDVRVRHEATHELVLGGALECVWRELTGEPPSGWGTAEPVSLRWDRAALTERAQRRAPEQSWFIAVGDGRQPAAAHQTVRRTVGGVEEEISLFLGFGAEEELPVDSLPRLAELLAAEHGLVTLLAQERAARADLVVPAWWESPPVPLAFALGPAEVAGIGLAAARRPPLSARPRQIGASPAPGFYYPLADQGWEGFGKLFDHLRSAENGAG